MAPAAAPMPAATRTDRRAAADAAVADTRRVFLHAQKLEKKAMQVLGVALRVYTHKCERIDEAQKRRNGACQLLKISETEHEWHLAQKAYHKAVVGRLCAQVEWKDAVIACQKIEIAQIRESKHVHRKREV